MIKPMSILEGDLDYRFHCYSCGGIQTHGFLVGDRLPKIVHCRLCGEANEIPDSGLFPLPGGRQGTYTIEELLDPPDIKGGGE